MLTFFGFLFFSPILFFLISLIPFQVIKLFQKPKIFRNWDNLHKLLPHTNYNNTTGELFINNIRNAKYNPIFESENRVEYIDKKYNLKDLSKLWILTNPFGFLQTHCLFSFQFGENIENANFLTLSYELRKENGKEFSSRKVLYKLFEGYYILATEQDVFYVRTNIRKNDGEYFLYELNIEKQKLKNIFLELTERINNYSKKAYKYKFLTRNCLTETLDVLRQEKIIKYNYFDYFFINRMLRKNNLRSHKIVNTKDLKPDENYSFLIRNRNHFT